jgi:hypothetical protein
MPACEQRGLLLAVASWVLLLPCVGSAEGTLSASVNNRFVYDSSPRLATTDSPTVSGYIVEPTAGFDHEGSLWQLESDLRLRFPFFDIDSFNIDEQRFTLQAGRVMRAGRFDMAAEYDRGSTLTADLANDANELEASRRNLASIRPAWTRRFGERNQIVLGATGIDVEFDGDGFVDYVLYGGDLTWTHQFTERTSVYSALAYQYFDSAPRRIDRQISVPPDVLVVPDIVDTSNDTLALNIGVTRQLTSSLRGSLQVGAQAVESVQDSLLLGSSRDRTSGSVYSGVLTYEQARFRVEAQASRGLTPSGVGQLVINDEYRLLLTHRVSRTLSFSMPTSLQYRDTLDTEASLPGLQRTVFRIQPVLRWRATRRWSLSGGLMYSSVDTLDVIDGVRVFINFQYEHPRVRLYR